MVIRFHPHASERMRERGATEDEVKAAVEHGEQFPVKFGRVGFRGIELLNANDQLRREDRGKLLVIKVF